jgi:5-methylcytosine-specific restriction endonuclease McrA
MSINVLQRPTLVLNKMWQPVSVQTVADALVKVWVGSARVVDPSDYAQYAWDDWAKLRPAENDLRIRLVGTTIRVPEVVTLACYDRVPNTVVAFSRKNLFSRDKWTCQYCGRRPGSQELTIDHVTPRALGGTSCFENCVAACVACNRKKADRTVKQAGMKLRTTPRVPRWNPAFLSGVVLGSWEKFVSEMYWNVPLEE